MRAACEYGEHHSLTLGVWHPSKSGQVFSKGDWREPLGCATHHATAAVPGGAGKGGG